MCRSVKGAVQVVGRPARLCAHRQELLAAGVGLPGQRDLRTHLPGTAAVRISTALSERMRVGALVGRANACRSLCSPNLLEVKC